MNILQKLLLPLIQFQSLIDNLPSEHKELLLLSLTKYDTNEIENTLNYIIDNTTDTKLKLKLRAFDITIDNSYHHLRELHQYNNKNVLSLLLSQEDILLTSINQVLIKHNINNKEIAQEISSILLSPTPNKKTTTIKQKAYEAIERQIIKDNIKNKQF